MLGVMQAAPSEPRGSSLAQCRLFETGNVEQARESISRIMQPHTLRPHGREDHVAGSPLFMDYLQLGTEIGIGTIGLGAMQVDVGDVDGYHLLVSCLRGSGRVRNGSQDLEVNPRLGTCIAPGDRFRGDFSNDCEQFVVRINDHALQALLPGRADRLKPVIDMCSAGLRPWLMMINTILGDHETVALIKRNPHVASDYEALLLNLLVQGHGGLDAKSVMPAIAPRSVRRAEEYIHANFAEPIRLEDLAVASEVPERTLQDAFRQFRGVSPMRYLRDVRLDAARRALNGDGEASVSQIALEAGFNHLGRFAQEYAARFGETPSRTLARYKRPQGKCTIQS